jgi:ureidoglycolate hydrolase
METYLLQRVSPQPLTASAFRPFGQVIAASEDGKPFGSSDAQLQLHNGIPRFYIMRLQYRGREFHTITRHLQCTQCLGSLGGKDWYLGVAPASQEAAPHWEDIVVFHIPGDCFIKLEVGTWHAGPYFEHSWVDFYNLELSDTNIVDHHTCNLLETHSVGFEIVAAG